VAGQINPRSNWTDHKDVVIRGAEEKHWSNQ